MKTYFNILYIYILMGTTGYSQQDAQYTQYMYNTIMINPAYAGSRGTTSIFGMYRQQWVGLDGAPVTVMLSVNTPHKNEKIGLGLSFTNDRIGPSSENNFSMDFSYTIQPSQRYKISFGLKATANLFSLDINKLNILQQGDPQFQNLNMDFSPNVGAGIYVHSDNTYFGFSVPNFLETKHYKDNSVSVTKERLHYYFITGHTFDFSSELKFKPTLLVKAVEGAPIQVDLSGNFLISDKLTLGVGYRWDAAVSALAGFQVSDSWFIGYAYDAETSRLANYNSGSHEIFLRYEFFNNYNRVLTPRFF
ncbi:type IX secretion system membrane protein PorP/SprF [Flavobacterium supellecticarium]|uniref:Type IX secretion system membrane protein PorP/SprF n=1 Tax=Flavobacterium supellecticarium TaxID=2565924 RepID=A0A4S4A561_9FLAO|nr:type IX secretion system membrane protein PorP/SprF [Flavobacterium supellecticarium]THF53075.1 type IX secretion system membrane protein PorP/SprF [Flavobacterium supellecticarium]